jgi:sortase (surface protein transpeptidase)
MKIILATHSGFLEQNLPYLERILLGDLSRQINQEDPTQADYVASFAFQPQPVLKLEKIEQIKQSNESPTPQLATAQPLSQASITSNFFTDFAHNLVNLFFGLLMLSASVVLIAFYTPDLYYSIFKNQAQSNTNNQNIVAQEEVTDQPVEPEPELTPQPELTPARYLPDQNLNLPEGDWLTIPLIGVNTQLQKTTTAEEALATGVWWVPDFGLPGDLTKPMIVSGHRYGWKWWWKDDYWRYHSFYRLPELQPGDLIEIISEQRKWTYEVYAGEEGTEITDYQADLILYTCKFLNSPLRIFRYAKLMR